MYPILLARLPCWFAVRCSFSISLSKHLILTKTVVVPIKTDLVSPKPKTRAQLTNCVDYDYYVLPSPAGLVSARLLESPVFISSEHQSLTPWTHKDTLLFPSLISLSELVTGLTNRHEFCVPMHHLTDKASRPNALQLRSP